MQNFDVAARYQMDIELYSMTLASGVQSTMLTGIVSLKKPFAVFLVDAALPSGETVAGFDWVVDGNNVPLITPTFTNGSSVVSCQVAVCYKY